MFRSTADVPSATPPTTPRPNRGFRVVWALALVCVGGLTARAQVTVQTIIGRAVTDDTHTADVTSAINRFSQRDFDGARVVLERIRSEDPKVPPPGVMMATM